MRKFFINNNSDNLLLFFTGWGCDEYEFEHLHTEDDLLILYDYVDLNLDFDFSKYKNINLLAFSAGVFVASIFNFNFKINKKIAISGNPYMFDEYFGLSKEIQNILENVNEENADDFVRNYLIKTEEEYKNFHISKRTPSSCNFEFECLKKIYKAEKSNIKDIYDVAICGEGDPIFNVSAQKEFYKTKLKIVKNARHNIFFRIKGYNDIFDIAEQ